MTKGFTKLVSDIVHSSIWNEPVEVRIVWITMLAVKDQNGYCRGDARTIARLANVSVEATQDALRRFQEPDPSSHTPDYEGRRIQAAPGGWVVLNHDLYRGMDYKEYEASRKQIYRKNKKALSGTCPGQVPDSSVSASVCTSSSSSVLPAVEEGGTVKEDSFDKFWKAYPNKVGKKAALRSWKLAKYKPEIERMLAIVEEHKASPQWLGGFIPHPATWLNQGRWDDEVAKPASSPATPERRELTPEEQAAELERERALYEAHVAKEAETKRLVREVGR